MNIDLRVVVDALTHTRGVAEQPAQRDTVADLGQVVAQPTSRRVVQAHRAVGDQAEHRQSGEGLRSRGHAEAGVGGVRQIVRPVGQAEGEFSDGARLVDAHHPTESLLARGQGESGGRIIHGLSVRTVGLRGNRLKSAGDRARHAALGATGPRSPGRFQKTPLATEGAGRERGFSENVLVTGTRTCACRRVAGGRLRISEQPRQPRVAIQLRSSAAPAWPDFSG